MTPSPLFGISLRRGPLMFPDRFLETLGTLPFGYWNVPGSFFSEKKAHLPEHRRGVISDMIPSETLMAIADDGAVRLKMQLCAHFETMAIAGKAAGARAIALDFGFADESVAVDETLCAKRLDLMKMIWNLCRIHDLDLLFPVRYPMTNRQTPRHIAKCIHESMCAGLKIMADVYVHELKKAGDIEKLFEPLLFDLGFVRFVWDAQNGNVVMNAFLEEWKTWHAQSNPVAPILFEPIQHDATAFLLLAREMADRCEITHDVILQGGLLG